MQKKKKERILILILFLIMVISAINVYYLSTMFREKISANEKEHEAVSEIMSDGHKASSDNTEGIYSEKKEITILNTLTRETGKIKYLPSSSEYAFQSFCFHKGDIILQRPRSGAKGKDGYVYRYDKDLKEIDRSKYMIIRHANGITYDPGSDSFYSVTVKGVGDNAKATVIDAKTLKFKKFKSLPKAASAIAYDASVNKWILSTGSDDGSKERTGYLRIYNSSMKNLEEEIPKFRWQTPGDICASSGLVFVTISDAPHNYIDIYSEETGKYLGSYDAPYDEIEGIDIDKAGRMVLLFHGRKPFIQFTNIKVIGE